MVFVTADKALPVSRGLDHEYQWTDIHRSRGDARKACHKDTRIPVELILRKLGEGMTERDLLDAYPNLTVADIRAAMTYAADALAHEENV